MEFALGLSIFALIGSITTLIFVVKNNPNKK